MKVTTTNKYIPTIEVPFKDMCDGLIYFNQFGVPCMKVRNQSMQGAFLLGLKGVNTELPFVNLNPDPTDRFVLAKSGYKVTMEQE